MKTIKEGWEEFKVCIPKNAPSRQFDEMQTAFYAGATVLFALLVTEVSEGMETEPQDVQLMENIQTELENYRDLLAVRSMRGNT